MIFIDLSSLHCTYTYGEGGKLGLEEKGGVIFIYQYLVLVSLDFQTFSSTLHAAHLTLHTAHYTLHTEYCTLQITHYTMYTAHCASTTKHLRVLLECG